MLSPSLKKFFDQQTAATFSSYQEGKLWIAARNIDVISNLLEGEPEKLGTIDISDAFIIRRKNGKLELWANPASSKHREASLIFAEQVGGVKLTPSDKSSLDSDHAFTCSASKTQSRVYSTDVGFVKMNLIDKNVNRAWGAGYERRHSHRDFTHELYCAANFLDFVKASGGASESWRDIRMIVQDGVDHCKELGLIGPHETNNLFTKALKEVLQHIQTSDESFYYQQIKLSPKVI